MGTTALKASSREQGGALKLPRRTVILAITAWAAIVSPDGHTARAQQQQAPIEIEVALHASAESLDTFLQSAREYERLRPGVRVNLYGDPRITDKIQVRILEGRVPEIINSVQNVWGLIDAGYM